MSLPRQLLCLQYYRYAVVQTLPVNLHLWYHHGDTRDCCLTKQTGVTMTGIGGWILLSWILLGVTR